MNKSRFQFSLRTIAIAILAIALATILIMRYTKGRESIEWRSPQSQLPAKNRYVLVASGNRVALGYFENAQWYWEDGGNVESQIDAWAPMPQGPYSQAQDKIDY